MASGLAAGVVEPARAMASMSVMSPVSWYVPGLRTSPTMKMRWLR